MGDERHGARLRLFLRKHVKERAGLEVAIAHILDDLRMPLRGPGINGLARFQSQFEMTASRMRDLKNAVFREELGKPLCVSAIVGVRIPRHHFQNIHFVANTHNLVAFSLRQQTAIHAHGVSGHKRRCIRAQPRHGFGHLFGMP